jgi:hypothetical protein
MASGDIEKPSDARSNWNADSRAPGRTAIALASRRQMPWVDLSTVDQTKAELTSVGRLDGKQDLALHASFCVYRKTQRYIVNQ